jgi:hypothetical protein
MIVPGCWSLVEARPRPRLAVGACNPPIAPISQKNESTPDVLFVLLLLFSVSSVKSADSTSPLG